MTARPASAPAGTGAPAAADASGLLALRSEFPILQRSTYLISHSLGAMPRGVFDRLREYAEIWATRGIRAWAEGWWAAPVETGARFRWSSSHRATPRVRESHGPECCHRLAKWPWCPSIASVWIRAPSPSDRWQLPTHTRHVHRKARRCVARPDGTSPGAWSAHDSTVCGRSVPCSRPRARRTWISRPSWR